MQRHDVQAQSKSKSSKFTSYTKLFMIARIYNIKLDPNRTSITGKIGWISQRLCWLFEGTPEQSGLSRICELKLHIMT